MIFMVKKKEKKSVKEKKNPPQRNLPILPIKMSKKLKAHRALHQDPINYSCGECRRVHAFDPDKPYVCPDKKKE